MMQAKELITGRDDLDPLEQLYVNNTILNIEKLDSVKATLAELRKTDGVNIKLINAVEDLTDVTSNINLAVHDNKELIDINTSNIVNISIKTQQIIDNAQNQEQNIEFLLGEIKELKNTMIEQAKKIAATDHILIESKLLQKVIIQEQYQKLEPELFIYAKTFSFGLLNYMNAYGSDIGFYNIEKDTLAPDICGKVISAVPVIGNSLSVINDFVNYAYSIRDDLVAEARIEKFKTIFIKSFLYPEDVSLFCCQVALDMAVKRYSEIKQADLFYSRLEKLIGIFEQKIEPIIKKITAVDQGNIDEQEASISKLALVDVGLFVGSICQDSNNRLEKQQVEKLINATPFELISELVDITKDPENSKQDAKSNKDHCIIFSVNDIVYDNELLNHPEMFNKLADIYGASMVLDLSSSISSSIINTAIQDNNMDLLLGSIISLETDF